MYKVIPIINATALIPEGMYCYTMVDAPSASNGFRMRVKCCPFWRQDAQALAEYGSQMSGYCDYLKLGDWMEGGTDLLWDQVKECGVNYGSPDV